MAKGKNSISHSDFQKLLEGFSKYDNLFCGHYFRYTYVNNQNKQKAVTVRYKPENFLHLSGCRVYDSSGRLIGGKRFYQALKGSRINNANVFYKDRFTKLKLQVLPMIDVLLSSKDVRIIEKGGLLRLRFDSAIRTRKKIAAIACIDIGKQYTIPESLINLKTLNSNPLSYQVITIDKDPDK